MVRYRQVARSAKLFFVPGLQTWQGSNREAILACVKRSTSTLISQRVFIESFYKGHSPHKFVNFVFILVVMKDTPTDLCGK